jgi:hypothetical protein
MFQSPHHKVNRIRRYKMAETRSHQQVALTILTVAEVPNFWSGFLPSLFTIATFSGGDDAKVEHTKHWIRRGEIQATGLSLALGVAASLLAEEPWPFLGVLFLIIYLGYQYEHALKLGMLAGPKVDMAQQ